MRKIVLIGIILALLLVITGCFTKTGSNDYSSTIIGEDGDKISISGENIDNNEWCQEGAKWNYAATGEEGGKATMIIEGIVISGKYVGMCHVTYDMSSNTGDQQAEMDFYFNEEGDGYQIMNINGQIIENEFHDK